MDIDLQAVERITIDEVERQFGVFLVDGCQSIQVTDVLMARKLTACSRLSKVLHMVFECKIMVCI